MAKAHPFADGYPEAVRIVLDTNVLLSATLKPEGLEARVVGWALSKTLTACVSPDVWAEYEDVLFRKKFQQHADSGRSTLESLRKAALWVEPATKLEIAADDDDNRFLECAVAAGARFLITGNLRHYPPALGTLRIVNARSFVTEFVTENDSTDCDVRETTSALK